MDDAKRDNRLAIVLDVGDLDHASLMAESVAPWMGVAKVGLELFAAAGPAAVRAMTDLGYEVFADLKFYDIPTQVGRASAQIGRTGARWLTIHTSGGLDVLRAGVEGLAQGSGGTAHVLGVTILTSDAERSRDLLQERVALARDAGCGGVVCSAADLPVVREVAPALKPVVPGIRLSGMSHHDQASVATPEDAIAAGAAMLVIGRAVTADVQQKADDGEPLSGALPKMAEKVRRLAHSIRHITP